MSMPEEPLQCERHGPSHATFVCQHLARGSGLGFFVSVDDPADPRPDAWCAACEEVSNAVGGWNEESEKEAGITLLCAGCYDEVRVRNEAGAVP